MIQRLGVSSAQSLIRSALRLRLLRLLRLARASRSLAQRAVVLAVAAWAAGAAWPAHAGPQAAPETVAVSKDSRWREAVTWEGRLSTPEADCQSDGLLLAPWGIYPNGSKGVVVWCVAEDVYPKLGAVPWELWRPVMPNGAEGYCWSWHAVGLLHEEPDGRFWCDEPPSPPERKPGPSADSA